MLQDALRTITPPFDFGTAIMFCDEDQMDMQHINNMSASAILHYCAPWTKW